METHYLKSRKMKAKASEVLIKHGNKIKKQE